MGTELKKQKKKKNPKPPKQKNPTHNKNVSFSKKTGLGLAEMQRTVFLNLPTSLKDEALP